MMCVLPGSYLALGWCTPTGRRNKKVHAACVVCPLPTLKSATARAAGFWPAACKHSLRSQRRLHPIRQRRRVAPVSTEGRMAPFAFPGRSAGKVSRDEDGRQNRTQCVPLLWCGLRHRHAGRRQPGGQGLRRQDAPDELWPTLHQGYDLRASDCRLRPDGKRLLAPGA
ncbi:hypothetical protein D3C85_936070 [compost metagenome]